MSRREVDVVIQGSGMVGLACAAALVQAGLDVAVVDARGVEPWQGGEPDLRVSAITRASENMFRALGVWDWMAERRIAPVEGIEACDGLGHGCVRFDAADTGEPHLAHIIENRLIQTALYEGLAHSDRFRSLMPGSIEAADADDTGARVRLDDGRRLICALVVGADGAGSPLRALAGIDVVDRDYGQRGVVAALDTERSHGGWARQRFLPGGPVAFLPLADGRVSLVWSLPQAEAEARLGATDTEFCRALTEASGGMLGEVRATGPRASFPLLRRHARRYCGQRLALIGDAAHVIHPLAGQGANLGLLDAAALAQVAATARQRRGDPGSQAALRRFERWRKGDNLLMQRSMDAFHDVFGRGEMPVVAARSLALRLTDGIRPLKRLFMDFAMGERPDSPRLARGLPADEPVTRLKSAS